MNAKQRKILQAIFAKPTSASIVFADIEALIVGLGGEVGAHVGLGERRESDADMVDIAAALDRRPAAVIERITLEAEGPRGEPSGFRITLHPLESGPEQPSLDLSLECWSLLSCADTVREATGLQLSAVAATEGRAQPAASGGPAPPACP